MVHLACLQLLDSEAFVVCSLAWTVGVGAAHIHLFVLQWITERERESERANEFDRKEGSKPRYVGGLLDHHHHALNLVRNVIIVLFVNVVAGA